MVQKSKMLFALRSALLMCTVVMAYPAYSHTADAKAIEALSAQAKRGDAEAQYELARRYGKGEGVAMNKALAFQLYTASAAQGLAKAEYELARQYSGVSGDRFDPEQVFAYTRKAAEHGYLPAQVDLAFIYYNGNAKVAKDLPLSFQWYRKAAQKGSVVAQCMLGDFYKNGLGGVSKNDAEAFKWYKLTATKDDKCAPKSQLELYFSYEAGRGVKKDLKTAVDWLQKAAEAGNPRAQYALGQSYQKGYGVRQDAYLAKFWLKKSREGVAPHDDHEHDVEAIFSCAAGERSSRACMLKSLAAQPGHAPMPANRGAFAAR